jgi:hypothetical protein
MYSKWRHGGWYVDNLRYPSGAVGCVSRNYKDGKWRIACDPRLFEDQPTFKTRDDAARGERALIAELDARIPKFGTEKDNRLVKIATLERGVLIDGWIVGSEQARVVVEEVTTCDEGKGCAVISASEVTTGKVMAKHHRPEGSVTAYGTVPRFGTGEDPRYVKVTELLPGVRIDGWHFRESTSLIVEKLLGDNGAGRHVAIVALHSERGAYRQKTFRVTDMVECWGKLGES